MNRPRLLVECLPGPPLVAGICCTLALAGCSLLPSADAAADPTDSSIPAADTVPVAPTKPAASSTPAPTQPPTPAPTPTPVPFASGPFTIGYSVTGRPLVMYRFGSGPDHYLIVAGIHGGYEWNTIELANQLVEHLTDQPELVPERLTLYVLPSFNPDGEARSHSYQGRANEHGVDLNRNWPSQWQAEWPSAGCWDYLPISGGTSAGSEPEVVWLMDFILRHDIQAIISYHSAALGIFPGGQPALPESVELAEALAEVAPYPYPPLNSGCLYTGQFADWAAGQGIPAVDVELTNHRDTDLEINLEVLQVFLNWQPASASDN